jgi:hypothetical protein
MISIEQHYNDKKNCSNTRVKIYKSCSNTRVKFFVTWMISIEQHYIWCGITLGDW